MSQDQDTNRRRMTYQDRDRWKHRRRMAYASLIGGLLFPLLMLGAGAQHLSAVAGAFYFFVGTIVGGYIGFATWDEKNKPPARRMEDKAND
jgi:predicted lipid-binding transport protein (Tim44 family)